ncbi:CAP domain-containing protein (plasmid) [Embleya sp. NBC_00888]|uniref:CAP domain-containing protein n=1 Tax=Embleya sp. NBC_00888 TaxID=2975960 RepID=UPI002F917D22|nr:CAP domain-containing protein [Embleya sp. NBC_00888]
MTNSERAKHGCGPLADNAKLQAAAQGHSNDMAKRGYFDHIDPDGADPSRRITAAGYRWSASGENIAAGQASPAEVMNAWMASPGHRANILNCSFEDIGVGVDFAPGGPRWTQNFGASQ